MPIETLNAPSVTSLPVSCPMNVLLNPVVRLEPPDPIKNDPAKPSTVAS
jgi:hypothetical protein